MGNTEIKMIRGFIYIAAVVFICAGASLAQDTRYIGGPGITVFADSNFRGTARTFQNNVSDLRSSGLDNRISSLRIGPGEQWEVCAERNYRGGCVVVSGEESDLGRNNWNDRISSLRRITGGGWNPGNPGDGQQVSPPAWARGTFYGTAPNGTRIILTINNNGSITANIGGSMNYGSFVRGNMMRMNEALSRVNRQGNGFVTIRTDNGERIVYTRDDFGGTPGNPGEQVSPPNWARGTFRGRAPNGTRIVLTISSNGSVTANIGGSMNYGSFLRGNYLRMNEALSRVTRTGNGFTTTRTDNGEVIYYTR